MHKNARLFIRLNVIFTNFYIALEILPLILVFEKLGIIEFDIEMN